MTLKKRNVNDWFEEDDARKFLLVVISFLLGVIGTCIILLVDGGGCI